MNVRSIRNPESRAAKSHPRSGGCLTASPGGLAAGPMTDLTVAAYVAALMDDGYAGRSSRPRPREQPPDAATRRSCAR